jgi:hypothetical protein
MRTLTLRNITFSTHSSLMVTVLFFKLTAIIPQTSLPGTFCKTGVVFSANDFSNTGSYNGFEAVYFLLRSNL